MIEMVLTSSYWLEEIALDWKVFSKDYYINI